MNVYNALIESSLLYGSETWRLAENNKRRVEATEMDVLRRSSIPVMGKLFKEGAKGKEKNFRRANIIY